MQYIFIRLFFLIISISPLLGCVTLYFGLSCSCIAQTSRAIHDIRAAGFGEADIDSIISGMTLEEKIDMVHGNTIFTSPGVARLGIRDLTMDDGPSGVREEVEKYSFRSLGLTTDSATFFPTGSALAATWNPALAERMGSALGEEARARGKDILLAPAVNIDRTPVCGRTFEYLSEDPFLNSRLTVGYINGVQSRGVAVCVKHYIANNQEVNRGRVSVEMDERTLREIYLPSFEAAVREAHVQSVMAAYNRFRGDYCSENSYLLNTILRKEWNFPGIVMSDWGGTHSTVNAALNGLDLEMGSRRKVFFGDDLPEAVRSGKVPVSTVDDKVRRILRVMSFTQKNPPPPAGEAVSTPAHNRTAYDVAKEAVVLLKNSGNLLPLNIASVKSVAVIGDNATCTQAIGGFGAGVKARYEITPLEGLKGRFGSGIDVRFAQGYEPRYTGHGRDARPDNSPDESLIREAVEAAKSSDIAILIVGTNREYETEASDRTTLTLPFGQDELIRAVAAANPKTVVVVVAGAPVDLSTAIETSPAILYSWFNGSEAGNALADVLLGVVNPSGKLPFTFPASLGDSPAHALLAYPGDSTVTYREGILVGYRWYDTENIRPQFCFGYGLSYTNFTYSGMRTDCREYKNGDTISVSLTVQNIGKRDGLETIQLYVGAANSNVLRAARELKSFMKINIAAGSKAPVTLRIPVRALAYFDMKRNAWIVEPAKYTITAGSSSNEFKAATTIEVKERD